MSRIGKAAGELGIGVTTVQRWDREDRLKGERIGPGRRVCCKVTLDSLLRCSPLAGTKTPACCLVLSAAQRRELTNQRLVMKQVCVARGLANVPFVLGSCRGS